MKLSWFWVKISSHQFLKRKSHRGSYLQQSGNPTSKLTISSKIWNPAKALSCTYHHYDLQKGSQVPVLLLLTSRCPLEQQEHTFFKKKSHNLVKWFLTWFLRLIVKELPEILILEMQICKPCPQDKGPGLKGILVGWCNHIWELWSLLKSVVMELEIRDWPWLL